MDTTPKPGYKTTEFWLSALAVFVGVLSTSGVLGAGSQAERVCGLVVAVLGGLGYTASRASVKGAHLDVEEMRIKAGVAGLSPADRAAALGG